MKKQILFFSLSCLFILFLVNSCEKDMPYNPYDDVVYPSDTATVNVDPNSIIGLHKNVFKPVCANIACHDGTNEPEFTTVESSYNTLVYHTIIKNDNAGTYEFRVMPGSVNESLLYSRLTSVFDTASGMMPTSVDPDSDWPEKREEYLQNIRTWIENGAPDMYGNSSWSRNKKPYATGVVGFEEGTTTDPFELYPEGDMALPHGTYTHIDLWFSIADDSTALDELTYKKIQFSDSREDFSNALELDIEYVIQPIQAIGLFGEPVNYHFLINLDLTLLPEFNRMMFFRIYIKDPQHEVTELPQAFSENHIKSAFSFRKPK